MSASDNGIAALMGIDALARDPDVAPLWPSIIAGKLEGSPGQVAAFAEACSTHGLDELEVGAIVAQLRAHRELAARMATPPQLCVVCGLVVAPEDRAPGDDGRPFYERFHAACRAATWCSTCGGKLTTETDSEGRPWCGCGRVGAPLEVEVGDGTAIVWAGHGLDPDDLSGWGQSYGIDSEPLDVWMLVDRNVGGFDCYYHRVAEGHPGAEPYTMLSREPWEIDVDVEASRAAMREDGEG